MTCRFCNGYVVILPSTFSKGGRATCGNCLSEHLRNTSAVASHETPLDVTQAADRIAELEAALAPFATFAPLAIIFSAGALPCALSREEIDKLRQDAAATGTPFEPFEWAVTDLEAGLSAALSESDFQRAADALRDVGGV